MGAEAIVSNKQEFTGWTKENKYKKRETRKNNLKTIHGKVPSSPDVSQNTTSTQEEVAKLQASADFPSFSTQAIEGSPHLESAYT